MSSSLRPDNLRAALDAKLAAAMSQLDELREAEQPRVTLHLNPREIVGTFRQYSCRVYVICDTFGRMHAGDLQFDTWYSQWTDKLGEAERALWKQFREERVRLDLGLGTAFIEAEIPVPSNPAITARESAPGAHEVRKRFVRFAAAPTRAASAVCDDYLRLAKRFAQDFVRDYARFLP